ncbi:hypothetical protein [Anaerotruncus colihominis]|uniref:hypothetical protein n=1 Tax=Anaerotruncus colihominis TaxID=169435 RepID=UPI000B37D613|nr:hypothetical protein [Anaerotruncus colihominis]OUO65668.1 hypothetical protein B5F55_16705 [Anaerotruncus colihominis]
MKAFTVYQPYAYAIVAGLKGYETRPRRTHIRGRVAVHAGKGNPQFVSMPVSIALPESAVLHYGAVLGTVEIVDCVPVEALIGKLSERERVLGDYTPGRFAWVLKNPVMFDRPIPARGFQGWWNWAGEHCQECRCVSCDLFQTAGCLEGKDVCGKCNHESHTRYCPWHPDEQ